MMPIRSYLADRRVQRLLMAAAGVLIIVAIVIVLATTSRWRHVTITNTTRLLALYESMDYDLQPIRQNGSPVPRIDVLAMPDDWDSIASTDDKKRGFFQTVLPLVLLANRSIVEDRTRVEALKNAYADSGTLSGSDLDWLHELAARYRLDVDADEAPDALIKALLIRVDIVPPSMALAQAAIESGWGGSRFALEGNALFGQWTWDGEGMRPLEAGADTTHRVATFKNLLASVEAYMLNLNSQGAYGDFRRIRAAQRAQGDIPDGLTLATTLVHYSQEGAVYPAKVDSIIRGNQLAELDHAVLDSGGTGLIIRTR